METLPVADLRHAFAAYPTGIVLVSARVDGQDEAILVNSFASVSLDPPLISMAFTHSSATWPRLRRAEELGITVLGEYNAALVPQLRATGPARLAGITLDDTTAQARILPGGAASFIVRPHTYLPAGDHELVLFEVLVHQRDDGVAPLVYFDRRMDTMRPEKMSHRSQTQVEEGRK
jgi:flavin reductase (DIM6/NTAB) family NADH-FMN oxidoreductase RutF